MKRRRRIVNLLVCALLQSPLARLLGSRMVLLRYTGRRSGRRYTIPVMGVPVGSDLVVVAGNHETKTWWRNFTGAPQPVEIVRAGHRETCFARRLSPGDGSRTGALTTYQQAFPRVRLPADAVVVLLTTQAPDGPRMVAGDGRDESSGRAWR